MPGRVDGASPRPWGFPSTTIRDWETRWNLNELGENMNLRPWAGHRCQVNHCQYRGAVLDWLQIYCSDLKSPGVVLPMAVWCGEGSNPFLIPPPSSRGSLEVWSRKQIYLFILLFLYYLFFICF